jgi:PAS domain-containing protein
MRHRTAENSSENIAAIDKEDSSDVIKWVFHPNTQLSGDIESGEDLLDSKELYQFALNSIQDGVSILDPELHVRYVNTSMKHWYSGSGDLLSQKCHRVFHDRDEPCDNCPTLKTIAEKIPYMGL